MMAVTGYRKFVIGMTYIVLSFAALFFAPNLTDTVRLGIIQSDVVVIGLVIGGNAVEHLNKKKPTESGG
jgi:hypothetical protein